MLLPIVSLILMSVFFWEFMRRMKRKNFNEWILFCFLLCAIAFATFYVPIYVALLEKSYSILIARIIAIGVSLSLIMVLARIVVSEIKKFVFLEETPLEKTREEKNKIIVGLFRVGTVVELKHPDGRLEILCYQGRGPFQDNFININPKSEFFGVLTVWSRDSEYVEWAYSHSKEIGHMDKKELNKLIKLVEKIEGFSTEKIGATSST